MFVFLKKLPLMAMFLFFVSVGCIKGTTVSLPPILPDSPTGSNLSKDIKGKYQADLIDLDPTVTCGGYGVNDQEIWKRTLTLNADLSNADEFFNGCRFDISTPGKVQYYKYNIIKFEPTNDSYKNKPYCYMGYTVDGQRAFEPKCSSTNVPNGDSNAMVINEKEELLFMIYIKGTTIEDATEWAFLPSFHYGNG